MRTPRSPRENQIPVSTRAIHIALICLTLLTVLGLDWVQWKKGKHSCLFSNLAQGEKIRPPKKETLTQIVLGALANLEIQRKSVNQFKDDGGSFHLMIDIPFQKYGNIEKSLENTLLQHGFRILKREEQKSTEKNFFLWEIEGEEGQKLAILFSCRKESPKTAKKPGLRPARNKVALIVDDMGYSLEAINLLASLGKPLTVAIIPFSPLALETATISRRNNLEVILHLPLESINNSEKYSVKGMIFADMSEEDIIKTVDKNLEQVPFIQGVNNHMGSRITADTRLMRIILGRLRARNLFFIDSRTTGSTVAHQVAQSLGIPTAFRHVFLDGEPTENYIKGKFMELLHLAEKNGFALGIGHPLEETLKFLKENFHLIEEHNLEPVFASQVVQ
ncbi:MAG: divergent polysaccharide deacetylase family protein [Candidatus Aminicenantes bacterium]|nr:divergent polysaccharide deacetylase family protein [Candidatus Aminicenantes bacterium]